MSKKFMVVKPTPCCGNPSMVGSVFESLGITQKSCSCAFCGKILEDSYVQKRQNSQITNTHESRIIWLPDEQDVLTFDKQNELENV